MKNGWTSGQYSIYRSVLGLYLMQHFLGLLPWGAELFSSAGVLPSGSLSPFMHIFPNLFLLWDSPAFVNLCLSAGAALSVLLIIGTGKFDRIAAALIWYLWACLYGRNPLIGNPSLPFIGWLLLAHTLIPSASWRAQPGPAKSDPWKLPPHLYLAAWILMSLAYTYSGYTKLISPSWVDGSALGRVLANPLARDTFVRTFLLALPPWFLRLASWSGLALELSFAPLALFRRVQPWIWMAMVGMHVGLMLLVNFADLTAGMLILHFFTFNPAWAPSPRPTGETIFYDGECGLCHGFVRFTVQEDQSAQPFSFAPLQGDFMRLAVPEQVRKQLPDSVAVIDAKNNILVRSSAVIYVMKRLGGLWYAGALLLSLVPQALRDFMYDKVASVRKKIFGSKKEMCPLVPPPLRERFRG